MREYGRTYRKEEPGKLEAEARKVLVHLCYHAHVGSVCDRGKTETCLHSSDSIGLPVVKMCVKLVRKR